LLSEEWPDRFGAAVSALEVDEGDQVEVLIRHVFKRLVTCNSVIALVAEVPSNTGKESAQYRPSVRAAVIKHMYAETTYEGYRRC
jgi:hypothetical protein